MHEWISLSEEDIPTDICRHTSEDNTYEYKVTLGAVAIISMIFSISVGLAILYVPKLRIHPSKLIAYMLLCEAISSFHSYIIALSARDVVCYFNLNTFLQYSTFNAISFKDATTLLCETNSLMVSYFQFLSLAFNFCLCHDLIQTLKNPFYPGKRRMKFYFWGSAIIVWFITFGFVGVEDDSCKYD